MGRILPTFSGVTLGEEEAFPVTCPDLPRSPFHRSRVLPREEVLGEPLPGLGELFLGELLGPDDRPLGDFSGPAESFLGEFLGLTGFLGEVLAGEGSNDFKLSFGALLELLSSSLSGDI